MQRTRWNCRSGFTSTRIRALERCGASRHQTWNILLSDDGRTKLADFGIAKINDATHAQPRITATNQVLGTAHYLAPEQLNERNAVDHRVDIYALGVILYELLTGQLPVGNFDPASRVNPQVGSEVDGVLSRALQQRPTARYQSVDEFRLALQKCTPLPGLRHAATGYHRR